MPSYEVVEDVLPRVAIAGATGHLGQYITNAFLSEQFHYKFSEVVLLTRQSPESGSKLQEWTQQGAKVRVLDKDGSLSDLIADVDILVNTIGSSGSQLRDEIVKAISDSRVKMYFPSEFGVDHTVHDFGHGEWDKKKRHFELVKEVLGSKVAVCRVYCGLFLEDSVGPWFGFDTKNGRYEAVGDGDRKATYTSLVDVGKVVAQLARMNVKQVPGEVHVAGDIISMKEIAEIMGEAGGEKIEVAEVQYDGFREEALKSGRKDPSGCLRFLMGDGRILHTKDAMGCDNDVLNPGQSYWKWKTMKDLAVETKGKPWVDVIWPPEE